MGNKAKVLITPKLFLNDIKADVNIIKDQLISVTTINDTGIPSTLNFSNI